MSLLNKVTNRSALTVSRASTKLEWNGSQFVEYAANVPAYRTVNGSTELSVEAEETNPILHNCDPSQASWSPLRLAYPASTVTAPNGSTAVILAPNTVNNSHNFRLTLALSADTQYTLSWFAKPAGLSGLTYSVEEVAAPTVWSIAGRANLDSGAFNNNGLVYARAASGPYRRWSEDYGNGWFRYGVSFRAGTAGDYLFVFGIAQFGGPLPSAPPASFAGNGVDGVAFWDFQLTPGRLPGSPIVTGAAAATRSADVVTISGNTYRALGITSGCMICVQHSVPGLDPADRPLLIISDGTANNEARLRETADKGAAWAVVQSGNSQASLEQQVITQGGRSVVSARFGTNDVSLAVEGAASTVDETAVAPANTQIRIGTDGSGDVIGGTIKRITLWNRGTKQQSEILSRTSQGRKIRVILAGGQSNAVGNANSNTNAGFPDRFLNQWVDGVQAWYGGSVGAIKPINLLDTGADGSGRSLLTAPSIANNVSAGFLYEALRLYAQSRSNVVLCQVTQGGTPLAARAGFDSWNADYASVDSARVALSEALEDRYAALLAFCAAQDIEVETVAMVWHQGETDNPEPFASEYEANLKALITKVRSFTRADLPWISGTVPATSGQYSANVRAGMLAAVADLAGVVYRDNDDLTFHDGVHFDPPSWIVFGEWVRDRLLEVAL
jgi:hypothetical protein